MQCRAERMDIIGFSSSEVTNRHIETVYKVDKLFFGESFEQFAVCLTNRIPAHMRHFIFMLLRNKTLHVYIKDIQAVHLTFFGVSAHQLHTEANSEHRLTQILDQFVEPCCFQVIHGSSRLSHSGENHFIGRLKYFFIGSNHRFYPQPLQSIVHRTDISGIVFYNCYFHQLNITVLFL